MIAAITDTAGFFAAGDDELDHGLDDVLRARVKAELEPGERLLWAGRSMSPGPKIGKEYYVSLAIAMLLLGLGVYAIGQAVSAGRARLIDDTALAKGGAFCSVGGLLLVITTYWRIGKQKQAAREAGNCYAVTDRRAISWTPEDSGDAVRVDSWPKGRIGDVSRVERPDGSGSLEFTMSKDTRFYWPPAGFKHIQEVRRVEQIVRHNLTTNDDVS